MAVWSTNNFTGGMNNYIHPALLDEKTAVTLRDAVIDNGKLRSVCSPSLWRDTPATCEDFGHYSDAKRSAVKWYGISYWSYNNVNVAPFYGCSAQNWGGDGKSWQVHGNGANGLGVPHCVYDASERLSGARPLAHFSVETDASEAGTKNVLCGTFKYCLTLVDHNGWEGAPGSLTSYFRQVVAGTKDENGDPATKQYVVISLTASEIPANVSHAKVWRTMDNMADFYYVGDISADNNWTMEDTMEDSLLLMRDPLMTTEYDLPPDNGKYLCESGGVFFLAVGTALHFSVQDNPHAWPTLNYIGFDDEITGIAPEFSGVLVFTRHSVWRVTGAESQETISRTVIPGNQGCISYASISAISNAPIWVSQDGVCLWNGESIDIVSARRVKFDRYPSIYAAASCDDKYYLFLEDGTLVYDRKNGGVFYFLSIHADYAWRNPIDDRLYLQIGEYVHEFEGTDQEVGWLYKSPYIGGTEMLNRVYREIVVACSGKSFLTVEVEGKAKLAIDLPAGRQRVKLPLNLVGRWLQFTLEGKGELSELAVTYGDS